jgi:hypothetical protein
MNGKLENAPKNPSPSAEKTRWRETSVEQALNKGAGVDDGRGAEQAANPASAELARSLINQVQANTHSFPSLPTVLFRSIRTGL